jgi:hypothetical protein
MACAHAGSPCPAKNGVGEAWCLTAVEAHLDSLYVYSQPTKNSLFIIYSVSKAADSYSYVLPIRRDNQ